MAKILLIEDDRQLIKLYEKMFAKAGLEVATEHDGAAGLRRALAEPFDAIVLDIVLPKMDGETVLRALRQDERGKNIPVILLTNLSYLQREDAKQLAQEYLVKANTDPEALVSVIKKYVTVKES